MPVISEHSKPECSLFVSECSRSAVSPSPWLFWNCRFSIFADCEVTVTAVSSVSRDLFSFLTFFVHLCKSWNLMWRHGNRIKYSDPISQFSGWSIWTETDNTDSCTWTRSHQVVWSFQVLLDSVYVIWSILILSELSPPPPPTIWRWDGRSTALCWGRSSASMNRTLHSRISRCVKLHCIFYLASVIPCNLENWPLTGSLLLHFFSFLPALINSWVDPSNAVNALHMFAFTNTALSSRRRVRGRWEAKGCQPKTWVAAAAVFASGSMNWLWLQVQGLRAR